MTTALWHTGDTEQVVVTVTENGTNVESLAGATVTFALYNAAGTSVLSKTTDDFTLSAPTCTLDLADDDLDGLDGVYSYEVRVTDNAGNTQSATGEVYIEAVTL